MRKVLITASTFPRWEKDTEPRFILDYAKSLKEYYDVTCLVPACPGALDKENMEGIDVIRYHYFPIHKLETLCYPGAIVPRIKEKKIRALLVPFLMASLWFKLRKLSSSFDIVHSHWLIPQGIVQSNVGKIPYIVTGHGGDITSLNGFPFKRMKLKAMKKSSHITVVSNKLKEFVMESYPNSKTDVMPMGCDTSSFKHENKVDNYFNQGDKKVVLFVGRLTKAKGVQHLIEAVKNLDDVVLYIAGKGDMEDELRRQAEPLGKRVVFMGPKTHEELSVIVPSADVMVVPSITGDDGWKEGFGLVIIEAMASGVPVVASNSGGIPDTITSGENGLLTKEKDSSDIASSIRKVLDDDALRNKLISNGFDTASKYDYKQVASYYKNIIDEVLDGEGK